MQLSLNEQDYIYFQEIDSTNKYLLANDLPSGTICIAEKQNHGYGRNYGSRWLSPHKSLLFSASILKKGLQNPKEEISHNIGLSIYISLAIMHSLEHFFAAQKIESLQNSVFLKWPNDIYIKKQMFFLKIGGVLIENSMQIDENSTPLSKIVIGIGLNWQGNHQELDEMNAKESKRDDIPKTMYVFSQEETCPSYKEFLPTLISSINTQLAIWKQNKSLNEETINTFEDKNILQDSNIFYKGTTYHILGIDEQGFLIAENIKNNDISHIETLDHLEAINV